MISVLAVCGLSERVKTVSNEEFGGAWPFTVDSVGLMCEGTSPKAFSRTIDGTVYALNGSARTQGKNRGWADGQDITKPSPTIPYIKMDYSNFAKLAQYLCRNPLIRFLKIITEAGGRPVHAENPSLLQVLWLAPSLVSGTWMYRRE